MTSEVENIKMGLVVTTTDFDNNKKIIGVNDANITPDENGVSPLGKQNAFIKEEKIEQFDAVAPADAQPAVEETLDFGPKTTVEAPAESAVPAAAEPPKSEGPKFVLPEALVSDTVDAPAVDVAPTDTLQTLLNETPATPPLEIRKEEETTEEKQIELQIPVMDEEVLAGEPTAVNNDLFVDAGASSLEEKPAEAAPVETPADAPAAPAEDTFEGIKMVPSSAPSGGNVKALEDIAQRLDELVVIIGHIKDDIKEYTKGLGVEEAPAMEEAAPAQNEQAPSAAPAEEETERGN